MMNLGNLRLLIVWSTAMMVLLAKTGVIDAQEQYQGSALQPTPGQVVERYLAQIFRNFEEREAGLPKLPMVEVRVENGVLRLPVAQVCELRELYLQFNVVSRQLETLSGFAETYFSDQRQHLKGKLQTYRGWYGLGFARATYTLKKEGQSLGCNMQHEADLVEEAWVIMKTYGAPVEVTERSLAEKVMKSAYLKAVLPLYQELLQDVPRTLYDLPPGEIPAGRRLQEFYRNAQSVWGFSPHDFESTRLQSAQ